MFSARCVESPDGVGGLGAFIQASGLRPGIFPCDLGMGASNLDDTGLVQGMLFGGEERRKHSSVDAVADAIKVRFGTGALWKGSSLERGERLKPS